MSFLSEPQDLYRRFQFIRRGLSLYPASAILPPYSLEYLRACIRDRQLNAQLKRELAIDAQLSIEQERTSPGALTQRMTRIVRYCSSGALRAMTTMPMPTEEM